MSKKTRKQRQNYSPEFKQEAIELAKEIGTKEAAEKLGIKSLQTISAWIRYSKKIEEDDSFRELERLRAENKKLKKELDIEKKSVAILKDAAAFFLSGPPEVKYRGLVLLKEEGHPIRLCCELLKASYSGFYDWLKRPPSKRKKRDGELKSKIISIFGNSKKRYGSPRIQKSLQAQGEKIGKDKVAQLMREEGLRASKKKKFQPKTTINNPSDRKSPRVFEITKTEVKKENQVWASDLTYLPTGNGFSYLVVVLDLFNRQIKGWDVSDSMDGENTKNAVLKAVKGTPGRLNEMVFHSDQGIQYCSGEVRKKLKALNITQSMSRKGNCYDNAFVESFFHTLKNELEKTKFKDLEEARKMIREYINWYNRERLHSSLGYLSPMDYVNQTNRCAA